MLLILLLLGALQTTFADRGDWPKPDNQRTEKKNITTLFRYYDFNKNGSVSWNEVFNEYQSRGRFGILIPSLPKWEVVREFIRQQFEASDLNKDNELNLEEFAVYIKNVEVNARITSRKPTTISSRITTTTIRTRTEKELTDLERAFRALDRDGSGGISLCELANCKIRWENGPPEDERQIRQGFAEANRNNDTELNFEEFAVYQYILANLRSPSTTTTTQKPETTTTAFDISLNEIKARFDKTDRNKNGQASLGEVFINFRVTGLHSNLLKVVLSNFKKFDVLPRDGFLNRDEYKKFYPTIITHL